MAFHSFAIRRLLVSPGGRISVNLLDLLAKHVDAHEAGDGGEVFEIAWANFDHSGDVKLIDDSRHTAGPFSSKCLTKVLLCHSSRLLQCP